MVVLSFIFMILFLLATFVLVVGLVRPSLLAKEGETPVTRGRLLKETGSIAVVLFILTGVTAVWSEPNGSASGERDAAPRASKEATSAIVPPSPPALEPVAKEEVELPAQPITKRGYLGCVSKEHFDQLMTALAQNDRRGADYLFGRGCLAIPPGLEVSILDATWTGSVRIRVYAGTEALELWTVQEAVDRSPRAR